MDKFFNSTFDALTNVLPGAFTLCVLYFAYAQNLEDIMLVSKDLSLSVGAIWLLASYTIGFIITPIGRYVFFNIGLKIFPIHYADTSTNDLTISEKFSLVREFSPANFRYIETWNMFSTFSYSLSVGFVFLAVVAVCKMIISNADVLLMIMIVIISLCFSLVLLKRAAVFKKWAADDMNACIKTLNLIERSKL